VEENKEESRQENRFLDNPLVQAAIVIAVVVAFILILAWRLGGLKDFELAKYQEPTPLTEVLKAPNKYANQENVKIAGVLKEATGSADFILVQKNQEILVKPQSGLHPEEFANRGEIGVGGKLTTRDDGSLVLEAASFEVLDLEADAARARAQLMAEEVKPLLAAALKVTKEELKTSSALEVDWPDTSLGAPEAGHVYAQVVTKGYKITFKRKGTAYEVHTDEKGDQVILVKPTRQNLKTASTSPAKADS
jgi:hypothetical protein